MKKASFAIRSLAGTLLFFVQLVGYAHAQDVPGCGSLANAYGPFDYRNAAAHQHDIPLVEKFHFTPQVEFLIHGSTGSVLGDLDYTLRAIPNHPRALAAMARYALQGGRFPPTARIPNAECYFLRALAFTPDDPTVHEIYADFLYKLHRNAQAKQQYEAALRIAPGSAEINYNAGLFFLDLGDVKRAKQLANIAYAAGFPLPGLRNRIAAAESDARVHHVPDR